MSECDNPLAAPEWTLPARWVTVLVVAVLLGTAVLSGDYIRRTGNDQASSSPIPLNVAMHKNAARNAVPISVVTTAR